MKGALLIILLLFCLPGRAQEDSALSLRIIDANVCYVKKTSALNFSYYFENHSHKHLVVADYFEPCFWEYQQFQHDSARTLGLFLVIRDDSGRVLLPTISADSVLLANKDQYTDDSLKFFEDYTYSREKDYHFHTRTLRPKDVLINLYNLKLNRRKCFFKGHFAFDYRRKYRISLHYVAGEDIHKLVRRSVLGREDEIFTGTLVSNEVELCFR